MKGGRLLGVEAPRPDFSQSGRHPPQHHVCPEPVFIGPGSFPEGQEYLGHIPAFIVFVAGANHVFVHGRGPGEGMDQEPILFQERRFEKHDLHLVGYQPEAACDLSGRGQDLTDAVHAVRNELAEQRMRLFRIVVDVVPVTRHAHRPLGVEQAHEGATECAGHGVRLDRREELCEEASLFVSEIDFGFATPAIDRGREELTDGGPEAFQWDPGGRQRGCKHEMPFLWLWLQKNTGRFHPPLVYAFPRKLKGGVFILENGMRKGRKERDHSATRNEKARGTRCSSFGWWADYAAWRYCW